MKRPVCARASPVWLGNTSVETVSVYRTPGDVTVSSTVSMMKWDVVCFNMFDRSIVICLLYLTCLFYKKNHVCMITFDFFHLICAK